MKYAIHKHAHVSKIIKYDRKDRKNELNSANNVM